MEVWLSTLKGIDRRRLRTADGPLQWAWGVFGSPRVRTQDRAPAVRPLSRASTGVSSAWPPASRSREDASTFGSSIGSAAVRVAGGDGPVFISSGRYPVGIKRSSGVSLHGSAAIRSASGWSSGVSSPVAIRWESGRSTGWSSTRSAAIRSALGGFQVGSSAFAQFGQRCRSAARALAARMWRSHANLGQ